MRKEKENKATQMNLTLASFNFSVCFPLFPLHDAYFADCGTTHGYSLKKDTLVICSKITVEMRALFDLMCDFHSDKTM